MCWPRNLPALCPACARHLRRFSATSRIPTVIWVGRSLAIGTGARTGSRLWIGCWVIADASVQKRSRRLTNEAPLMAASFRGLSTRGCNVGDLPLLPGMHAVGDPLVEVGRANDSLNARLPHPLAYAVTHAGKSDGNSTIL